MIEISGSIPLDLAPDQGGPKTCGSGGSGFRSGSATRHNSIVLCAVGLILSLVKVGEALVRATRELGELTPAYKNLPLNTLMAGSVSAVGLTLLYC